MSLTMSLLGVVFGSSSFYDTFVVENGLEYLAHEVSPWIIACSGFVYLLRAVYSLLRQVIPKFDLSQWLVSIPIFIGTAIHVLASFASLLRINFSYLGLAIFSFIAISFIGVLCMSQLIGDNGKKEKMARNSEGNETTVMLEKFNIVARLAPHFILYVSGMVGDPDHDGNNYDISNFCLFLTCMLQDLSTMMTRLPATISPGIAPVSELLYKSSLVVLLFTAHMIALNSVGEKVLLLLLPEVVPPLLWVSLHLDRPTPTIKAQDIVDSDYFSSSKAGVVVAMCGSILQVVHKDESFLYWAGASCAASGLITYIIVLVLQLWPEKAVDTQPTEGEQCYTADAFQTILSRRFPSDACKFDASQTHGAEYASAALRTQNVVCTSISKAVGPQDLGLATLSFEEILDLLTFWSKFLLQVAVVLFSAGLLYHLFV